MNPRVGLAARFTPAPLTGQAPARTLLALSVSGGGETFGLVKREVWCKSTADAPP